MYRTLVNCVSDNQLLKRALVKANCHRASHVLRHPIDDITRVSPPRYESRLILPQLE